MDIVAKSANYNSCIQDNWRQLFSSNSLMQRLIYAKIEIRSSFLSRFCLPSIVKSIICTIPRQLSQNIHASSYSARA